MFLLALMAGMLGGQAQQKAKKYPSLLWQISGKGMAKPSYLYGTWHVSEKMAFHLSDTFFLAIESVDMVALELNPDTWLREHMDYEAAEDLTEFVSYYSRPGSFYKKAFSLNIPEQKDIKYFLKQSPTVVNTMLYRTSAYKDDFEEDTYLDLYIFQAGKKLNKKVTGLEAFRRSRELVRKAETCEDTASDDEKREQLRLKLKDLQGDRSYSEIFEDAYRTGDLDLLDSLYTLTQSKACYKKYMLDERNIIMADQMDSIMKHNSLFAGVGAAHLPGHMGVVDLLRRKGYTVRPVTYTDGFNNKTQKKLEELRYPVQLSLQHSNDSAFSVMAPGKFNELSDVGASKSYLFNDMSNGAYYYIQRVNYFGGLTGETPSAIIARMDSILYDNIPGKILSRKNIKHKNGYPGFDIVNKTRRGDVQRYQIFVTPEEIYIFKMSGTGEYVQKGKEADMFFNSISFRQHDAAGDRWFTPERGEYKLKVPASATVYKSSSPQAVQKEIITGRPAGKDGYFFFVASSLYDMSYIEGDTFELNFLAETFARQLRYKVAESSLQTLEGRPTLDAYLKNDSGEVIRARIFIKGHQYYLVGLRTKDALLADGYLSSFAHAPLKYNKPFQTFTDTVLHFRVKTHLNPSPFGDLVRPYSRYSDSYSSSANSKEKKKKEEKEFLPVKNSRVYVSNETGEKISVEFRKFSMYYQYNTLEKFWNEQLKSMSKESSMIASRKRIEERNGIRELNVLLTDTGSSRGFMVKMLQKCGSLYTLRTYIDTIEGPSAFVQNFFTTFQPKDTCIGSNILDDKLGEHFFSKIYSADASVRKRAENAVDYVRNNMNDTHAPLLMKTIDNPGFGRLELKAKTELIKALGTLKSKEIIPFFEKLYERYTDSLKIQLAILNAVSAQRSMPAVKSLLGLLRSDLPVSKSSTEISDIFSPLMDTLQVARELFPDLLAYAKYPDLRSPIYKLLYNCVEKGQIRKKDYSRFKDDILNDARYDLKLYMSSTESSSKYYSSYSYSSYRTSAEPSSVLGSDQLKLYWYISLLAPFYKSDPDVKKFVDKTMRTKHNILKVYTAAVLLRNNVQVSDSTWKYLATENTTRYWLYRVLEKEKRLDKFDTIKYGQKELVISMLYNDNEDFKKDTVVLVEKLSASAAKHKGYVYVFKSRPLDKKIWKMSYIGVMPELASRINYKPEVYKRNISYESEKQMKKELDDMLKKLRIDGRKRASVSDFDTDRGYYGYDDYSDY